MRTLHINPPLARGFLSCQRIIKKGTRHSLAPAGDSGNLKNAIGQGHTVSHVHIKTQVNGANDDPLNHIKTKIDPKTGRVINPCNN